MVEIKINNYNYRVYFVKNDDENLLMDDGDYHSGTINYHTHYIYINKELKHELLRYTLVHEITHAFIESYGFLQVDWNDEIVADFMAIYGNQILLMVTDILAQEAKQ